MIDKGKRLTTIQPDISEKAKCSTKTYDGYVDEQRKMWLQLSVVGLCKSFSEQEMWLNT